MNLEVFFKPESGPNSEKSGNLAVILINLDNKNILFDEN